MTKIMVPVNQTQGKMFKGDVFKPFTPKIKLPIAGGSPASQIVGAIVGGALGLGLAIIDSFNNESVSTPSSGPTNSTGNGTSVTPSSHKKRNRRFNSTRSSRSRKQRCNPCKCC